MHKLILVLLIFVSLKCTAQNAIQFDTITRGKFYFSGNDVYLIASDVIRMDQGFNPIVSVRGPAEIRDLIVAGTSVYAWGDSTITKMDRMFNVIWSKHLDDPVFPCHDGIKQIQQVVVSDNRVFIFNLVRQPNYDTYLSTVTLDTSGNYISHWCEYVQVFWKVIGIPDTNGTCWVSTLDPSPVEYCGNFHLNSQGYVDATQMMYFAASAQNTIVAELKSSNNDRVFVSFGSFSGSSSETLVLRANHSNSVISQFQYNAPVSWLVFQSACLDDNDNLYIIGSDDSYNYFIFKTNSTGQITNSKSWTPATLASMQLDLYSWNPKLFSRNDSVFMSCRINGKLSMVALDSTLSGNCFSPASTYSFTKSNVNRSSFQSPPVFNQNTINVQPITPSIQSGLFPAYHTTCYPTGINQIQEERTSLFYPNPAHEGVTLFSGDSDWKITDSFGRLIKSEKGKWIDLTELSSGVYILNVENRKEILIKQ